MNINTLTVKAQEALQSALSLARERGQQAVEPLHILSVLVREDDSLATFLLGRVGVNVRGLRDEADRAVASLPRVEGGGDQYGGRLELCRQPRRCAAGCPESIF